MRSWDMKIMDELLEGEFNSLKNRKDIYIEIVDSLPFSLLINYILLNKSVKKSITMWLEGPDKESEIKGPIHIYKPHWKIFKKNPLVFRECLRHELLHIKENLHDEDKKFKKLCKKMKIPTGVNQIKKEYWQT